MPLVLRLLARALNIMTPRRVHLSTGLVVILSIASTTLLICVAVLRSPGVPIGNRLSYSDGEIRVPMNYTLESVFDELKSIKRHNPVESPKDSEVKTAAQLMESSLPPLASQAHKQERSTRSADLQSISSEDSDSIRSSSTGAVDAWWRSLQANRTARVRELCVAPTPARDTDLFRECGLRLDGIFVDRSNRILYCAIPKVASSSVKLALALMTGRGGSAASAPSSSTYGPPVHSTGWLRSVGIYSLDYLVDSDPRWLRGTWSSLRKFLVVRHPVERLVSAYVDKFTLRNRFSHYFQRRYGRKIVRLYRNNIKNASAESSPRPREKIADSAAAAAAAGSDVSFREFVQFLVDQRIPCAQKYNGHWASYFDICHPCLVDYDFVVRFERLGDEMRPLWRALYSNRSDVVDGDGVLPRRNAGKRKSGELVGHYVGQLRSDHISALYYAYERDFRLFAYNL